ncbi:phosphatase PAP2 family protein [Flavobacteriaceae bacterium TP-CH-4]|uniref:Phosphatase PAP2 family protein n=1 Tax=Pelagihabitans pacificus TaxID=2696054 RepID=A0A967AWD6_9FLAO|nr:phosphatase PAP2 family protein [Pelagihabitans pacificus]NHF57836.1 phosphatase PAP2 family protein [Pelagihabitans pacificus]
MLEELIRYDKELFLYLNKLGSPAWDGFWLLITNKISLVSLMLYAVLLYLAYRKFGPKKLLVLLVGIVLMILITDQLANFFKYGVQRLRPCHDSDVNTSMRLVKDYCGGQFGYFSAHASNTMAVAIFFSVLLSSKFRYIGIFLVFWAFLVAYSRIYIGVHFPLDVLTGVGIGAIFGWLFAKLVIFALDR